MTTNSVHYYDNLLHCSHPFMKLLICIAAMVTICRVHHKQIVANKMLVTSLDDLKKVVLHQVTRLKVIFCGVLRKLLLVLWEICTQHAKWLWVLCVFMGYFK